MTSVKIDASRLAVLAVSLAGFVGAGLVPAAAQEQVPQGWFKACSKQEDVDICNVQPDKLDAGSEDIKHGKIDIYSEDMKFKYLG